MELKQLQTSSAHDAGADMIVKDQFGKDTDFVITLVGVDSTHWRELRRQAEREALEAAYVKGETEHGKAYYMAEATLSWRGLMNDGKVVVFSKEAAIQLYEAAPYIADQADRFIATRQNFMLPSSKD